VRKCRKGDLLSWAKQKGGSAENAFWLEKGSREETSGERLAERGANEKKKKSERGGGKQSKRTRATIRRKYGKSEKIHKAPSVRPEIAKKGKKTVEKALCFFFFKKYHGRGGSQRIQKKKTNKHFLSSQSTHTP